MQKVIELLVKVEATNGSTGPHEQGAVTFTYSGLNQSGKEALLDSKGNLDLTQVSSNVRLAFVLENDSITWSGQKWSVKLPADPVDALWIFENQLNKKQYSENEPEFKEFNSVKYSNRQAVAVTGNNRKNFIYDYAIAVEVSLGARTYTHRHDPQIKNGGLRFNLGQLIQRVVVPVLLACVALLLAIDIVIRIRTF